MRKQDMRVIWGKIKRTGMNRDKVKDTCKGGLCCGLIQSTWHFEGQAVLKDAYTHVN